MSIIKLDDDRYFSTADGIVVSKEDGERLMSEAVLRQKNLLVHNSVQVIHNLDRKIIEFSLTNRNDNAATINGYLITVYLQDDNGLTQLYNSSVIDPSSGATIRSSLQEYINIEVDV